MVELVGTPGRPGFEIKLAQRDLPREAEAALKRAAEQVLSGDRGMGTGERAAPAREQAPASLLSRVLSAVRRLFSASA
jgi:hypothetical protein